MNFTPLVVLIRAQTLWEMLFSHSEFSMPEGLKFKDSKF